MTDLRTWDAWHNVHQPFELDWWTKALAKEHFAGYDQSDEWRQIKAFVNPRGKVLDIGCGPKPMFAPCTVIEPLAKEYIDLKSVRPEWCQRVTAYPRPAEDFIEHLRGKFDTVICWNCLDHTIGWLDILKNISRYSKADARVFVATDFFAPFVGHPGFARNEFMREVDK